MYHFHRARCAIVWMSRDSQVSSDYVGQWKRATRTVAAWFYPHLNLKPGAGILCEWFSRANPALCDWVCAVSPRRRRAAWRAPAFWKHSGMCQCGARTDTGTRCNLWRVLFDYRTATVILPLSASAGITDMTAPAPTSSLYLVTSAVNITLTANLQSISEYVF